MPTLANFQGGSLVADIRTALENIGGIGERDRAETAAQEAEDLALTARGVAPPARKGPLDFLNKIAPDLFQTVQDITTKRADPTTETVQAIEATRERAKNNIAVSKRILAEPDPVKKQRIVREDAERIRAQGGDITGHVKMSNLSPDELDLQAQKVKMAAEATNRAVPGPTEAEREIARIKLAVRSPAAAEALRRQDLQNAQLAQAERDRLKTEAAPKTPLGQAVAAISADVNSGTLPASVGQALAQRAVTAATVPETPKFQTDIGKLIGDQATVNQIYGAGSPQAKAIDEMLAGELKGEAPKLTDVAGVRKEHTKQSSDFIVTRDAFEKIKQGVVGEPSGPKDIAMIVNFMKMNDPGSVVRESEVETIRRAQGAGGVAASFANKLLGDGVVSDQLRQELIEASGGLMSAAATQQKKTDQEFRALATRLGMDPNNVVLDFTAPISAEGDAATGANAAAAGAGVTTAFPEVADKAAFDALPPGAEFTSGGKRFRKP